jgi:hypothetical protein
LKEYLRYFNRSQILALLFEELFVDIRATQKILADFLDVDADRFPSLGKNGKVNASSVPAHQSFYGYVVKTGRKLRRQNLEPVVDFVKRLGVDRVLAKGSALPPLDKGLKQRLSQSYLDEFDALEHCMQLDLTSWRK